MSRAQCPQDMPISARPGRANFGLVFSRGLNYLATALGALLLAGQSLAAPLRSADANYLNTAFIANAFTAVVHGREYEAGSFVLSRWPGEIKFHIHEGIQDPQAVSLIEMHLSQLGDISGRRFTKAPAAEARLEIFLTRQRDWRTLVTDRLGARAAANLHGAVCLANYSAPGGVITAAQVFIPVDQARMQGKLVSCVVEEITQIMGLPNDSEAVFPSIFNDRTPDDLLTPLDWVLIKLLYHPDLAPGMTASQSAVAVKTLLRRWQADGTLQGAPAQVKQGELYRILGRR